MPDSPLLPLAEDFIEFENNFGTVIQKAPLQIYSSALIFSPTESLTRKLFQNEEPDWITRKPIVAQVVAQDWPAGMATHDREHSDAVTFIAFSPDGRRIASGSYDNIVKLWDPKTGVCMATLEGHSGWVPSVAFSPNSRYMTSRSFDDTIKLWDLTTGACMTTLKGHSSWITSIAFSPNGCYIASGSFDNTIKLWDLETGACMATLEGHSGSVTFIAFSPNLPNSPNCCYIASGSFDNTIKLWDSKISAYIITLKGHSGSVTSIAFSPDSRYIASGSFDNTVKLWDLGTGACIATLEVGIITKKLVFDPTSSHLYTDVGNFPPEISGTVGTSKNAAALQQLGLKGYGISADGCWITCDGLNTLWLPKDYRPIVSDVSQRTILVGCSTGRVWSMEYRD